MTEEELNTIYYLDGWKVFIYRIFMKYVYPEIKKGHKMHRQLIESGDIAHLKGDYYCPICKK